MARGRHDYEKSVVAVEMEGLKPAHGRTLMFDDFEDTPLKWTPLSACTYSLTRQAAAAYNGSFGMQILSARVGAAVPCSAQAIRQVPLGVEERAQYEMYWKIGDQSLAANLNFGVVWHDELQQHYALIRYVPAVPPGLGWWQIWDGAWNNLLQQRIMDGAWNEFSLRCDFGTDRYIDLTLNNRETNISNWNIEVGGVPTGSHLFAYVQVDPNSVAAVTTQYDDILIREVAH